MNFILKISTTIFILLLMSCHVETPSKSKSVSRVINSQNDRVREIRWWKKMNDPILNDLVARALKSNNQILHAKANVIQAQAQLKAAYSAWLPTLSASASGFLVKGWNTQATPEGAFTQTPVFSNLDNLKIKGGYTGFVPNYSLNILENTNNTKLAAASLEMQKATYRSVQLSIISQTTGSYFTLLGQKQQLIDQKQLIQHWKQLYRLENARHKDGATDYSILADIEQEMAASQAQISSIESSMTQVQNALQLLTGHDPGPIMTQAHIKDISTKGLIPPHLSAQVLQNRPDLMMAKENLNKADASLGIAYSRFFPQISLTGLLGGSSIELVHLLKLTTGLGIAQVAAIMPVFNAATYQQIQAAKAGVKAAYFNYIQTIRSALVDVDNSLTKNKRSTEAYNHQLKAYHASIRAYRIVLTRYKTGFQDRRTVVNALLNLDKAKKNLTVAKMEQLNSIVEVYQAVAGGVDVKSATIAPLI